jgi:hypothetical protein
MMTTSDDMATEQNHRWAHLLKQQTLVTVHHVPTKENKLPFSVCRKQTEIFPLSFSVYINIETAAYISIYIDIYLSTYLYIYLPI